MIFTDLKNEALAKSHYFKIVLSRYPDYDEKRELANSRIDLYPGAIAYCEVTNHVAFCIKFCQKHQLQFRVRSGGHHHEGMCSADEVLIIDLSKMNDKEINYNTKDKMQAWLRPGMPLKEVYTKLEAAHRVLPGGGCGSVCIGGLTLGGGWGLYARQMGMTCDNVIALEIVLADGKIVEARADNKYKDLFWATRGGGGGNFGIVTRFLFQLSVLEEHTYFILHYKIEDRLKVIKQYIKGLPDFPNELTTASRLTAAKHENKQKPPCLIVGLYQGSKADLLNILTPLYDIATPIFEEFAIRNFRKNKLGKLVMDSHYTDLDPSSHLGSIIQPAQPSKVLSKPQATCDSPQPHKISSGFPRDNYDEIMIEKMIRYLDDTPPSEEVYKYLSIHAMGGAISDKASDYNAFVFRNKEFIMQFQAWWADPNEPNTAAHIQWVEGLRTEIANHLDGAFINFPDKLMLGEPDLESYDGRMNLLSHYYQGNLARLQQVKAKYDKNNLFSFGMSIPLPIEA